MVRRALADTSVFIADETGRPLDRAALPPEIAVSAITYGELRWGVLAAADVSTRERRLATLMRLARFDLVPVDEHVAEAWAKLRAQLRERRRALKMNDAWIAATAIALQVPLLSRDADFDDLPGLTVLRV